MIFCKKTSMTDLVKTSFTPTPKHPGKPALPNLRGLCSQIIPSQDGCLISDSSLHMDCLGYPEDNPETKI